MSRNLKNMDFAPVRGHCFATLFMKRIHSLPFFSCFACVVSPPPHASKTLALATNEPAGLHNLK